MRSSKEGRHYRLKIKDNGKKGYCPDIKEDPLDVTMGSSHFNVSGKKDFLSRIVAYEPDASGASLEVETYRGCQALVRITFVQDTVFRFQMFPEKDNSPRLNEVFSFRPYDKVSVIEEEDAVCLATQRLKLIIRKCPWELTVVLDGEELTREHIYDRAGEKYKADPVGFTVDKDGRVTDAFETFYMGTEESFYGFGEKFTGFNKRGQKITVWQRDAQSTNTDISYKGMPYFMSTAGYSVLLNTYTRSHFNMGASSGVSYTMETEDPYLDYYMFCNRDYKGLLRDYTSLSGRSRMIPRWAFGFWMSKMSYMNRQEIEETVLKMEEFGMSVDVIHIDGWLDVTCPNKDGELLCFDEERFPDPEGMIRWLRDRGIHLSLWMYPFVQIKNRWKPEDDPSVQYLSMKERGFLVKNQAGEDYVFPLGEGEAAWTQVAALDFTNPEFVSYIKERVKRLIKMGVGVIKTDFSEEVPEDAVYYDGSTGLEGHNKYPLLYSQTIYEAAREAKEEMGERAMIWCRSGFAGSQNYPGHWAGDSSSNKNNLLPLVNGGLSFGISGVSFWGYDIGGFYNSDDEGLRAFPEDEEYIRSVQLGMLTPLSRAHGNTSREPWHFSETAQKTFLIANKLRYRLLPYLYSAAYETYLEGIPMMRAMLLEFQEDLTVRNVSSQYMLGGSLLVAPVFDQKKKLHVYLPAGSWIDFYSGERITGERWITCQISIDRIPLFIRENTCLPMLKEAPAHIAEENFTGLEILMNLTGEMTQCYYDDGVQGRIQGSLSGDTLEVITAEVEPESIKAYLPTEITRAVVNGMEWKLEKLTNAYMITKEDTK